MCAWYNIMGIITLIDNEFITNKNATEFLGGFLSNL